MKSTEATRGVYVPKLQRVTEMSGDSPALKGLTHGLDSGRKLLFRLRWTLMSPGQRYAHLWARTKRSSFPTRASRLSRN